MSINGLKWAREWLAGGRGQKRKSNRDLEPGCWSLWRKANDPPKQRVKEGRKHVSGSLLKKMNREQEEKKKGLCIRCMEMTHGGGGKKETTS